MESENTINNLYHSDNNTLDSDDLYEANTHQPTLAEYQAADGYPMSSSSVEKSNQNHYTSDSSSDDQAIHDGDDVNVQAPQGPEGNTMFRNWDDDDEDEEDDHRINTGLASIVVNVTGTNGTVNVHASHADFIVLNIDTNRGTIYVDARDTSIVIVNIVNNYGIVRTISADASIIRLNINNTHDGIVVCTRD